MLLRTLAAAALLAGPAFAQDAVVFDYDGSFEDANFAVESAIVGRGLVVDYVSHVGEMLARTGADVGSDITLFDGANAYLFCSAVVSRQVMEADPMNVAQCPYSVFVTDQAGKVSIGYRRMESESLAPVQELLNAIATEAVGN